MAANNVQPSPSQTERPWSPIALAVLAVFFPMGALVASVRNLRSLGVLDGSATRFYSWAATVLLASLIVLAWSIDPTIFTRAPGGSASLLTLISIAAPFVCFGLQIRAFKRWRASHPQLAPRSWLTAVVPSIGITVAIVVLGRIGISILGAVFSS